MIAEHKRSSPSAGVIRADLELARRRLRLRARRRRGALGADRGEPLRRHARGPRRGPRASSLPILRKDFIVEEYQVHEALAGGADAILLIVAALDTGTLVRLHALATQLGLATLVEVHDAIELDAAHEIGAEIVGINNRDLDDARGRRRAHLRAARRRSATGPWSSPSPASATAPSSSGSQQAGVDAVLIGEALMRAPDIEAALARPPRIEQVKAPKIKFCGITREQDAELAVSLGAWAVGMIMWPHSPRAVPLDRAAGLAASLKRRAEIVGVFVNPTLEELTATADAVGLTILQLHGQEGPAVLHRGGRAAPAAR